ncbi:MAG: hypothetical protein WDZ62_01830 [Candidatus Pacearchaeota archaeon]
MQINNTKNPESFRNNGLNFGNEFCLGSTNRKIDLSTSEDIVLLGTTNSEILKNLGTTEFANKNMINAVATMKIPSNRLLMENSNIQSQSHSPGLVTLPYSYSGSEDCPWQFFNRAERRFIK